MKHLFYFKKGEKVPQWLMAFFKDGILKNTDGVFCVNGKVCVDDKTGNAYLWVAKKHRKHVVHFNINTDDNEPLSDGNLSGSGSMGIGRLNFVTFSVNNHLYRKRAKLNVSPLTMLRRNGEEITTSTKCKPLPDQFNRIAYGSPLYEAKN